ncbi:MAG: CBS domain-containing protein [Anaerolineaceae bacterium]|nr:CBS domain-containing protein [Anaerolineaceae bacterium]
MSDIVQQLLAEPIDRLNLTDFCMVTTDTTVRETIERMQVMHQNIALIIGKGSHLVGVLTDRDVMQRVMNAPENWDQPVTAVMTPEPKTLHPQATAAEALRLMESGDYRNVPVVNDNGVVRGCVTYYAILKFLSDHFSQTVYNLPSDPTNFAENREGG